MGGAIAGKLLKEDPKDKNLELFLPDGDISRAPVKGQFMTNLYLAKALRLTAKHGKSGFYEDEVAEAIVKELGRRNHVLSTGDLRNHTSTFVEPINYEFLGHQLWEIPPNGSGIIALMTWGLIKNLGDLKIVNLSSLKHNSAEYLHIIIECSKLSFKESEDT